jgi:hypothetical protein
VGRPKIQGQPGIHSETLSLNNPIIVKFAINIEKSIHNNVGNKNRTHNCMYIFFIVTIKTVSPGKDYKTDI